MSGEMSPGLARSREVASLRAEVERLREALRWYAVCPDRWDYEQDAGQRAQAALDAPGREAT